MNVLSLFDGMSCGRIALERCGFKVDNYFASEIDKYAIKVAKANYPDTVHLGDVTGVMTYEDYNGEASLIVPYLGRYKIDILIGGSPCQGFSFAGKQLNFEDPRSKLFFEYVRLLRELKPKYFLLENVNMKQEYQDIISSLLGVEPIRINSNLVSAQNRDRLYWTNIPVLNPPRNRNIMLKDILEDGWTDRDKSHCIDANYFKGGNLKSYFQKNRRQLVFDMELDGTGLILAGHADLKGHDYNRRVYDPEGKAPSLCAASGGNLEPKVLLRGARIVKRRLDENGKRKDNDKSIPLKSRVEVREDEKSNCLSTIYKDSIVADVEQLQWRKLTPLECERLQTVPENYTDHVSNTQRYRMLGNGWTVDVICHILEGIRR